MEAGLRSPAGASGAGRGRDRPADRPALSGPRRPPRQEPASRCVTRDLFRCPSGGGSSCHCSERRATRVARVRLRLYAIVCYALFLFRLCPISAEGYAAPAAMSPSPSSPGGDRVEGPSGHRTAGRCGQGTGFAGRAKAVLAKTGLLILRLSLGKGGDRKYGDVHDLAQGDRSRRSPISDPIALEARLVEAQARRAVALAAKARLASSPAETVPGARRPRVLAPGAGQREPRPFGRLIGLPALLAAMGAAGTGRRRPVPQGGPTVAPPSAARSRRIRPPPRRPPSSRR